MADATEDAYAQRVTTKQREVMVAFMLEHSALATGRFKPIDGAKERHRLTKEFSDTLNAVADGATKTPEKWIKCWQDWKSDVKKKARKIKRHANETGGTRRPCHLQLTQLEEDVMAMMGQVAAGGQETTDPLDAEVTLMANANQPDAEAESSTVPVVTAVAERDTSVALPAMPANTWIEASSVPSTSTNSVTLTPMRRSSPVTSDFSEPSTAGSEEGHNRHKRKRSEGDIDLTRSPEERLRNANNLSVQLRESRLQMEMKKLDFEMAMKEKEVALKEKELALREEMLHLQRQSLVATQTAASAMASMAMAVTAAIQTFQASLTKQ